VPIVNSNGTNGQVITNADTNSDTVNDAFTTTGCCNDAFGRYDLNTAGTYTVEAIFNEQGGGSGFFVYGAKGDFNTFTTVNGNPFVAIGDPSQDPGGPVAAGLQLVPEPAAAFLGVLSGAGLLGLRRRRA
jgi:hypothetical protein